MEYRLLDQREAAIGHFQVLINGSLWDVKTLFRRFKADESAQTITARIRRLSPEDNNERQPIHEHESVELPAGLRVKAKQQQGTSVGGGL